MGRHEAYRKDNSRMCNGIITAEQGVSPEQLKPALAAFAANENIDTVVGCQLFGLPGVEDGRLGAYFSVKKGLCQHGGDWAAQNRGRWPFATVAKLSIYDHIDLPPLQSGSPYIAYEILFSPLGGGLFLTPIEITWFSQRPLQQHAQPVVKGVGPRVFYSFNLPLLFPVERTAKFIVVSSILSGATRADRHFPQESLLLLPGMRSEYWQYLVATRMSDKAEALRALASLRLITDQAFILIEEPALALA